MYLNHHKYLFLCHVYIAKFDLFFVSVAGEAGKLIVERINNINLFFLESVMLEKFA